MSLADNSAPHEEAARWRAIIESAVDAIVVIDQRGVIESFNPAAERMFGYRAAEVTGRNVSMLMPAPYASEHDRYLSRYVKTGKAHIIGVGRDVEGRRRDGSVFPAHLSVGELRHDGQQKFTGIIRDLTDRVDLEMKLREEAGLARVGELAAALAHEVRNPLAAVGGALQILGEKLASGEDREVVAEARRRLDGLSAMMTDLLLYARPPKPRLSLLDVAGLVDGLIGFLRMDPAWQNMDCRTEGDGAWVMADAEMLKLAVQNLLLNALHAVGGKGMLIVRTSVTNGFVNLDVIDSGPGIPPEVQARLFTPFFTTKARGTGLGLATVRRIARAHQGDAMLISTGHTGTALRIMLPLHPDQSGPAEGS